ncbi:hypothetical protein CDIK_0909 [Cucumispora dikerogammari]|nr:hypothetical protein CDIK_0909 [Cucumispora dikerogammari]
MGDTKANVNINENKMSSSEEEESTLRLFKVFTMSNVIASFNEMPNLQVKNFKQSDSDAQSIASDTQRCFHFIAEKEKTGYQEILKNILLKIRVPYFQGMADIAAYIVYFILTTESTESVTVSDLNPSASKMDKITKTVEKILQKKVIPLVENDFKKYKKINSIFIKMLQKRNINMTEEKSMSYLSNILTFFTRDCSSLNDTYFILAVILSCPSNIPFLILIKHFKLIENKKPLSVLEDKDFLKDLITLEDEYLEFQAEEDKIKNKNATSLFVLGGGLVVAAVAVGMFFLNKKK